LIERCQDRIASARNAAQRRAFDDLGHVLGGPDGKTSCRWQRCEDRRVTGAAGNDDVDARSQGALERAHTHLTNDVGRSVHFYRVERRHTVDWCDTIQAKRLFEHSPFNVGAQHAHAKAETLFASYVAHDRQRLLEMWLGAGRSGGADDEGNFQLQGAEQHFAQVPPRGSGRGRELAAAKIVGTDVDRSHVATDQMRLPLKSRRKRRRRHAVSELPGGAKNSDRLRAVRFGKMVQYPLRCGHISSFRSGVCC
jgi:hypothetical protein